MCSAITLLKLLHFPVDVFALLYYIIPGYEIMGFASCESVKRNNNDHESISLGIKLMIEFGDVGKYQRYNHIDIITDYNLYNDQCT